MKQSLGLTDGATQMFLHETGNDADGTAMTAFVNRDQLR